MLLRNFIHRTLLALLLLSGSLAGMASPARVIGNKRCEARAAMADVCEKRRHQPQDAVLSVTGYASLAASLQTGFTGGAGGYLEAHTAVPTLSALLHLHWSGKMQLRRWRLLFSAVRYAQLRALYPAHGFW